MNEPATASAAAAGTVAIGMTGQFFGVGYDALVWAFLGGIVVVLNQEGITPRGAAFGIVIAMITSAALTELVTYLTIAALAHYAPGLPIPPLRIAMAFALAFVAQKHLLPGIPRLGHWFVDRVKKALGQKIDEAAK